MKPHEAPIPIYIRVFLHCSDTDGLDSDNKDRPEETNHGHNLDEGSHFEASSQRMARRQRRARLATAGIRGVAEVFRR